MAMDHQIYPGKMRKWWQFTALARTGALSPPQARRQDRNDDSMDRVLNICERLQLPPVVLAGLRSKGLWGSQVV